MSRAVKSPRPGVAARARGSVFGLRPTPRRGSEPSASATPGRREKDNGAREAADRTALRYDGAMIGGTRHLLVCSFLSYAVDGVVEKTCKEGYYLNEETGRCRKIVENTGANYSLEPETYKEGSSFVALYAIILVLILVILRKK